VKRNILLLFVMLLLLAACAQPTEAPTAAQESKSDAPVVEGCRVVADKQIDPALQAKQFTACPPMEIDPNKTYTATLKTEKGDIVVELLPKQAPMAVNSFIFLARQGWFDGVPFHRVIPGFVAQGGDPSGSGQGGPGYQFDNEISAELKFDRPGMVGMANAGPGTNGSQFFITYAPLTHLDGGYTIFGRVVSGMEVAQMLTARDPSQGGSLPEPDKILSVVIQEQ
jgi:cyclophilin family peptidyl-prolyl cis-trans isomerase